MSYKIVCHSRKEEQKEVYSAGFVVEIERKGYYVEDTQMGGLAQQPIAEQKTDEEVEEQPAAEDQRRLRVVAQEGLNFRQQCLHAGRLKLRDSLYCAV